MMTMNKSQIETAAKAAIAASSNEADAARRLAAHAWDRVTMFARLSAAERADTGWATLDGFVADVARDHSSVLAAVERLSGGGQPVERPRTAPPGFVPGAVVRFREVVDAGDQDAVMEILEDRGDRVLVRDRRTAHWPIAPTSDYLVADLVLVEGEPAAQVARGAD